MSGTNMKRMWSLLLLVILISTAVFVWDSFRDDNFYRYDTAMYSTISQNILRTGNWLDLRYSFDTQFVGDHPPLIFWATALSFKIFGESAFSAAFFSILCAVGTCVAIFFIGRVLKSDIAGFFGAMGLLLTRYVPRVARFNTIEIPLMFFVALAVLFLILAHKKHRSFYLLFGACVGFSILCKGVVGVLPLGVCFASIIAKKRFRDFLNPFFLGGIFVSAALPWIWLFLKGGMTFEGAWIVLNEYIGFVTRTFNAAGRENPGSRMRFITKLFEICFIILPGVFLGIWFSVRDIIKEKKREIFTIFLWAIVFIAAFMMSSWRRGFYLLPMYPALAVLFGIGLYEIIRQNYRMYAVYFISAFFAGNILAPFLFPHWEPKSLEEVVFKNTYYPRAIKAVKAIYERAPQDMRFIGYQPRDPEEDEFIFFFRSHYKIELCKNPQEFKSLTLSEEPILFCIPKKRFSRVEEALHSKLKIVYAFDDQLLVTNQMDMVPVFDKVED